MKAIFLTYDRHRPFAKQCLMTHEKSGAFDDIQYLVPWDKDYPNELISMFGEENVEDEEWVYWLMNDNYIDKVTSIEKARLAIDWVNNHSAPTDYSLQLFMGPYNIEHGIVSPQNFVEHKNDKQTIRLYKKSKITYQWRSQFCRAKVIKTMFSCLDEPKQMKDMDYQLLTSAAKPFWDLAKEGNFYAILPSVVLLAEQINKSKMTKNCADSFEELGLKIPDFIEVDEKMIIKMPPPGPYFI